MKNLSLEKQTESRNGALMKAFQSWFSICGLFVAMNSHAQPSATIKAKADKVEEIKGHVLQMVNGVNDGMLIEARRNKATEPRTTEIVFVVNYPGHKLREGSAIVVSAIAVDR